MSPNTGSGTIEVVCGSMFSGKTEELMRRLRRATIAKQRIQIFKPTVDIRYAAKAIASHNGLQLNAIPVQTSDEIRQLVEPDADVIAIDEIQFFDDGVVALCDELAEKGYRVICAGLDMDFRGEPFGPIPRLLAIAEKVDKLQAICMVCGQAASRTQRLIEGKPACFEDPIVLVGASEVYEARCRAHHDVPHGSCAGATSGHASSDNQEASDERADS